MNHWAHWAELSVVSVLTQLVATMEADSSLLVDACASLTKDSSGPFTEEYANV